jgi:hypothetical protein
MSTLSGRFIPWKDMFKVLLGWLLLTFMLNTDQKLVLGFSRGLDLV